MIKFRTIRWKNLLSTGNVFSEINFQTAGTNLIVGKNGNGKSTILEALTFALFGKPFRKINIPQMVNSINKKDMVVELEFHLYSNEYKIVRGLKPNIFEVYCNGVLLNQDAKAKDYQDTLEKNILRLNLKTFRQVVVLGSASFVPFMQLALAQRREIIEDLLDLEIFTSMNTLLKNQIQEIETQIKQNEIDKAISKANIEASLKYIDFVEKMNEKFITEQEVEIAEHNRIISIQTNIIKQLRQKLADLEKYNQISPSDMQTKLNKFKTLQIQIEQKKQNLETDVLFFQNHDECPTCKQTIDNKFKCDIIVNRKSDIHSLESGLHDLNDKMRDLCYRISEILSGKKDYDQCMMDIGIHNELIQHHKNKIQAIEKSIDDVNNQKTSHHSDENHLMLLDKSKTLNDEYNKLKNERNVLAAAGVMLKDSGIKTKLINQYIPVINQFINKYLEDFGLFVEFNLDEQFNEQIKSRHRDDFSYESFSEGEKQKIDLAILFTWREIAKMRNSLNTNILILDEIFDSSLDGDSAEDLLGIIKKISENTNISVITHRNDLHEKFDNVIKFIKKKNFSMIEVEMK